MVIPADYMLTQNRGAVVGGIGRLKGCPSSDSETRDASKLELLFIVDYPIMSLHDCSSRLFLSYAEVQLILQNDGIVSLIQPVNKITMNTSN